LQGTPVRTTKKTKVLNTPVDVTEKDGGIF